MTFWLTIPFFIQGFIILLDEVVFHYRREIPTWERIGHPLDTLTFVICVALARFVPFSVNALYLFIGLAIFSCLFITKDEWVHHKLCSAGEMWTHAVLFLIHPIALIFVGVIWYGPFENYWILTYVFGGTLVYTIYQFLAGQFLYGKKDK